jgi:RimJ/RimL family protein N-acetyltransferase
VAALLSGKKDLGIHTEMFTESMIDLFDSGAITNRKKSLWPNKFVFTFALGSQRMYGWLHDNPAVLELRGSYVNDPYVIGSVVGFNLPVSIDEQRRWIDSPRRDSNGPWHFSIVERASGEVVGLTSLHSVDWGSGTASDGIKLHPAATGRGLAYDACMTRNAWAFFVLGLRRLEATILDFNGAAQRHDERLGYTQEGRRREAAFKNGRWCDLLQYGLLRSEAERMPAMADFRALVAPVSTEIDKG